MRYLTAADARMRLHNSYCTFDGIPVFVQCPTDSLQVSVINLKTGESIAMVDANDERLDVESLPLGYVYGMGPVCGFAARLPYRQQKQGVSADNTRVHWERWGPSGRGSDSLGSVPHTAVWDMFRGHYVDFEAARKQIDMGRVESIPFHRKLALVAPRDKKGLICSLRYAGSTMGFFFKGRKKALVIDRFSDPVFRILLSKVGVEHEIISSSDSEADDTDQ